MSLQLVCVSDLDLLLFGDGGVSDGGSVDGGPGDSGADDGGADCGTGAVAETLSGIYCKFKHPLMFSHHDLLVSSCSLPPIPKVTHDTSDNITAPKVPNLRFKTKWSDEGIIEYSNILSSLLQQIRETWGNMHHNNSSISMLLSTTFSAMSIAAKSTNKVTMLGDKMTAKPKKNVDAQNEAKKSFKLRRSLSRLEASQTATKEELCDARLKLNISRVLFKKTVRDELATERDTN